MRSEVVTAPGRERCGLECSAAVVYTATEVSTSVVSCTINWGDVQICELKSVLICRIVHNGTTCKASVQS